ncbi:MAG: prolipoprotein diacylglyceryl transferase [Muribaculaceae bacterium]|jgi:prolipoprotein diacylglyceryl transferase|nr:prolipoprotein diacylglyceryl transferase [Muribaculaceae bacterium]
MLDFVTWTANPDLIHSFITVRWYGLMFAIGFLIGYNVVARIFKHEGAPEKWLGTLLLWTMAGTIIGARLGHVFFYEWDLYSNNPIHILYIWEGGLASHGGAIGVIVGVLCFSWITAKKNPIWTFDRLVIPVALVGGLIRLGNLMNHEIYGHATDLPWAFRFITNIHAWQNGAEPVFSAPSHPTQLYEAGCYFVLFALLMWMYWRKNAETRPGLIFGVFLIGIFLPRLLIEFVKNNQVEWEADMMLNMGQILSIPFIIAGICLIIYSLSRPKVHIDFPDKFAPDSTHVKRKK